MTNTEATATEQAQQLARTFAREWRTMVKDPLFALYNGDASDVARDRYIARRFAEVRSGLTAYLHRPECLALADAIDAR